VGQWSDEPSDPWLSGRPAERATSGDLTLDRAHPDDLEELVDSVNSSLDELRPWMPWAQVPATRESIGTFLRQADADWDRGPNFAFAIRGPNGGRAGALLGYCGLHDRIGPGGLEIGYWIRSDCTGRGVATSAAAALTTSALDVDGVTRVEIRCDAANVRSAAVPARLGFRLDRIESRAPTAPGETDRHMIWILESDAGGDAERDPI